MLEQERDIDVPVRPLYGASHGSDVALYLRRLSHRLSQMSCCSFSPRKDQLKEPEVPMLWMTFAVSKIDEKRGFPHVIDKFWVLCLASDAK